MEGGSGDQYYEVEKILKFQTKNGKRQYLIKWKNFPSSSNSWEPEENLTKDLVADYHQRRSESKKSNGVKRSASLIIPSGPHRRRIVSSEGGGESSNAEDSNYVHNNITPQASEREIAEFRANYLNEAVAIKGAVKIGGSLFHQVRWRDGSQDELIPAKYTNHLWPQLVIAFYSQHLHIIDP